MKNYPSSLLASGAAFVLIFSILSLQTSTLGGTNNSSANALSSFLGMFSKDSNTSTVSTVAKEGDSGMGVITCVTKTLTQWAPGVHYTLRYKIKTDKYFYVDGLPSLYPYNVNDPAGKIYPYAKYMNGSTTNTLNFIYSTQPNDGILNDSYSLLLNPMTGVNEYQGKIYTLNANGMQYGPIDLSGLNNPTLPKCDDTVKTFPGTLNLGSCSDGIMNGNETGIDVGGRCGPIGTLGSTDHGGVGHTLPYHWCSTSAPVTLGINNIAGPEYTLPYAQAFADWDLSPMLNLTSGNQITVKSGAYGNSGWIGVASVWSTGNHIIGAEVEMNDSYLLASGGFYNSNAWRNYIMCQEMGHTFGVDRQDSIFGNPNLGTCEDYTKNPDGTNPIDLDNEHPNMNDMDALKSLYQNTGDLSCGSYTTGNKSESGSGTLATGFDVTNKATWGTVVGKDKNNLPNVYVKNLGVDPKTGETTKLTVYVENLPTK